MCWWTLENKFSFLSHFFSMNAFFSTFTNKIRNDNLKSMCFSLFKICLIFVRSIIYRNIFIQPRWRHRRFRSLFPNTYGRCTRNEAPSNQHNRSLFTIRDPSLWRASFNCHLSQTSDRAWVRSIAITAFARWKLTFRQTLLSLDLFLLALFAP